MKKRRRIGITGPIGSGKSYVAQYLTRWGYPVYDADTRAKRLVEVDSTLRKRIVSLLGEEAYDAQGHYNRRMVASRVFADQSLLAELNALIHPAVLADYEAWCDLASYGTMIFFESALLPRLSWQSYLDAVLVVTAPPEVRMARIRQRDGASVSEIAARMAAQGDDEEYNRIGTYFINNDGRPNLEVELSELVRVMRTKSKKRS